VALTALATILLELSLTRIFSVVFFYHFAFLAISIALFGLGAGGLFAYALRQHGERLYRKLGLLALLNSFAVVGTLLYVLSRDSGSAGSTLALVYLLSALPFFLAGAVISTAIAETIARVHVVYFFDLVGAAAGCLLVVPLLNFVGGPNTVLGAAVLYAASSAIWFTLAGGFKGRVAAVGVSLVLVALVVFNAKQSAIDVRYAKGERLVKELYVKWNSFSRTALVADESTGRMSIHVDGHLSSGIANVNPDTLSSAQRRQLLGHASSLPYVLRPGATTLIIGPGGGWDVARALASGSHDVTGVERNPIIANTIMREKFPEASKRLYFRPGVRIVVGDGRGFLSRTSRRYQVLQIPLSEARGAGVAEALALSEDNLFTVEAFVAYLGHLTPDGILAFSNLRIDPPWKALRLAGMAQAALRRYGEFDAWNHVLVIRDTTEDVSTGEKAGAVLVSRTPFTGADIARLRQIAATGGIEIVSMPGAKSGNRFAELLAAPAPPKTPVDISPVTDNQPFFFYTAHAHRMWSYLRGARGPDSESRKEAGMPLLPGLVGASILATAIVLLLPPLFLGNHLPRGKGVRRFLWYFVFIGAGYVLIEVSLIQTFVLLLGNPTYALTIIVFSLLVSSGIGSFFSRRVLGTSERSLTAALASVALLMALLAVLIPTLNLASLGWPLWIKAPITVMLIAPAGFAMGMAFPAGLSRLEKQYSPLLRWAWALNASASIMGSVSAVFLAIHLGLRETLLIGGMMYVCALFAVGSPRRQAPAGD